MSFINDLRCKGPSHTYVLPYLYGVLRTLDRIVFFTFAWEDFHPYLYLHSYLDNLEFLVSSASIRGND